MATPQPPQSQVQLLAVATAIAVSLDRRFQVVRAASFFFCITAADSEKRVAPRMTYPAYSLRGRGGLTPITGYPG